jgi:hypothetical protein
MAGESGANCRFAPGIIENFGFSGSYSFWAVSAVRASALRFTFQNTLEDSLQF